MHSMMDSIKRALFGTTKEEEVDKKVNEDLEEVVKDAKKNFKDYLPHLGSGAIIGGGVGALAGLVGGPLAWAGIGAGAAFLKKSESAQKFLFGDKDLEGNRINVLHFDSDDLSSKNQNNLKTVSQTNISVINEDGKPIKMRSIKPDTGFTLNSTVYFAKSCGYPLGASTTCPFGHALAFINS